MQRSVLILAVLLAPAVAFADEPSDSLPLSSLPAGADFHLAAGVEPLTGGDFTSVVFRGQALVGAKLGTGRVQPTLSAGLTIGLGDLYVSDPRAAAGPVGLPYHNYGPMLELGLDLRGEGTHSAGARLFVSAAYLQAHVEETTTVMALQGMALDHSGVRAAVGFNWLRTQLASARDTWHGRDDSTAGFLMFLPQQLELTVERDVGATRWGGTFSWGF